MAGDKAEGILKSWLREILKPAPLSEEAKDLIISLATGDLREIFGKLRAWVESERGKIEEKLKEGFEEFESFYTTIGNIMAAGSPQPAAEEEEQTPPPCFAEDPAKDLAAEIERAWRLVEKGESYDESELLLLAEAAGIDWKPEEDPSFHKLVGAGFDRRRVFLTALENRLRVRTGIMPNTWPKAHDDWKSEYSEGFWAKVRKLWKEKGGEG